MTTPTDARQALYRELASQWDKQPHQDERQQLRQPPGMLASSSAAGVTGPATAAPAALAVASRQRPQQYAEHADWQALVEDVQAPPPT